MKAKLRRKRATSPTETSAFKAWFRGSKVVNSDGTPMRVYHGTARSDLRWSPNRPAYFSPNANDADDLAVADVLEDGDMPRVLSAYLAVVNPAILNWCESQTLNVEPHTVERLKALGHDGAFGTREDGSVFEYVAFSNNQIRSLSGEPEPENG